MKRPVKRAYKQDVMKIDAWLNQEISRIAQRAEEEGAEAFSGDETNFQNTSNYARGYAPKGQTPVVKVEAQKLKIEMLLAISKQAKLRFMLYKDSMNADKLIDFMTRLITDSDRKAFSILDNLRVYHAKKVMAWLEEHKDQIELFCFQSYFPEYNPDELLNSDIKRNAGARKSPRTQTELENNVQNRLEFLTELRRSSLHSFRLHLLAMLPDIHEFVGEQQHERTRNPVVSVSPRQKYDMPHPRLRRNLQVSLFEPLRLHPFRFSLICVAECVNGK